MLESISSLAKADGGHDVLAAGSKQIVQCCDSKVETNAPIMKPYYDKTKQ